MFVSPLCPHCSVFNDRVCFEDMFVSPLCKDVILHNLGRSLRLATFHVGSVKIVNV